MKRLCQQNSKGNPHRQAPENRFHGGFLVRPGSISFSGRENRQRGTGRGDCGGVEGPPPVDLGDLLDELDQVRVLADHEDVQVDAAGRSASLIACAASILNDRQMLYANIAIWK